MRSSGVNTDGLTEKWPKLKLEIPRELNISDRNLCNDYFGDEAGYFIALLKLLSNKPNFDEKVRALIIFTDVCILISFCVQIRNDFMVFVRFRI